MSPTSINIISLALAIGSLILSTAAVFFSYQARFWKRIFSSDNEPENLEEIVQLIAEKLSRLKSSQKQTAQELEQLTQTMRSAIRYTALKRFDSQADDGGNLSFTLALLNGNQTGNIITSLHGRQHNRIYCKQIIEGQPIHQLSQEEQDVLIDALTNQRIK